MNTILSAFVKYYCIYESVCVCVSVSVYIYYIYLLVRIDNCIMYIFTIWLLHYAVRQGINIKYIK